MCLIEHLLNKLPRSSELHVMYDIACNLEKHLKVSSIQFCFSHYRVSERTDLLNSIKSFVIPAFHAYGHSAQCQVSEIVMYACKSVLLIFVCI